MLLSQISIRQGQEPPSPSIPAEQSPRGALPPRSCRLLVFFSVSEGQALSSAMWERCSEELCSPSLLSAMFPPLLHWGSCCGFLAHLQRVLPGQGKAWAPRGCSTGTAPFVLLPCALSSSRPSQHGCEPPDEPRNKPSKNRLINPNKPL